MEARSPKWSLRHPDHGFCNGLTSGGILMLGHLLVKWGYPAAQMFVHPLRSRFAGTPLNSPSESGRELGLLREGGSLLGGLFCFLECG